MSEIDETTEKEQQNKSVSAEVAETFDNNAAKVGGEDESVLQSYQRNFREKVLAKLPPEDKDKLGVKIQELGVTIKGFGKEVGARASDLVNNVAHWPMALFSKDWPADENYQKEKAGADAWGTEAAKNTEVDLKKRSSYQENFLPAALDQGTLGAIGSKISKTTDAIFGKPATL